MAGDWRAIGSNHEQIKGVLIHLTDECWVGNGENKRLRGHPLSWRMFEARTSLFDRSFLGNGFQEFPDLPIGRREDRNTLAFAEVLGQAFEPDIFIHGHYCRSQRVGVELTNDLLKLRA